MASKRELVLHIGLPKTGSTAAQNFFSTNRAALLERSIDYLPIGEFQQGKAGHIASGNGAYLARSFLPKDDDAFLPWGDERVEKPFRDSIEKSSAEKILISSELFALPPIDSLTNLIKICEKYDLSLSILAVVRNHCDWLSSAYLQDVKRQQLTSDPKQYITRLYRSTRFLKYFTYFSAAAQLCDGRVRLISYDQSARDMRLMNEMIAALGVEDISPFEVSQKRVNVTPSPEEIAFLKICNSFGPRMQFSDVLAQANPARDLLLRGVSWTVIDATLQKEVGDYFAEEIARFLTAFKLDASFFSAPCSNFVNIEVTTVTSPIMVALFGQYLVAFDKTIEGLAHKIKVLESHFT